MDTFTKGERVELHPATDRWMRGDRFGTVVRQKRTGTVTVDMDKSNQWVDVHPSKLMHVETGE